MKLMLQRYRTSSTRLLFSIVALLIMLTVALVFQTNAQAQTITVQPTEAELKQVREVAVISAAGQCISNGFWGGAAFSERTLGEIQSYNWGRNDKVHVGHLTDSEDGFFGCEKEVPTAILNTLSTGLSVVETYCSLGAIPHLKEDQNKGYTCNDFIQSGNSPGKLKILRDAKDSAVKWLQSKASKRTLSADALIYVDALHLLQSRCKAEPRGGSADERANSNTRAVRVVTSDGSVKEQWYYIPRPDDRFSLSAERREIKCSDIANNVSQKSTAYAEVVQQKVGNAAAQTRQRQVEAGASKFYNVICPSSEHTTDGAVDNESLSDCQKKVAKAWSECTTKQGSGPYTPGNTVVYTPTADELLACMKNKFPDKASRLSPELAKESLNAAASVEQVDSGVSTSPPAGADGGQKEESACNIEGGFGWIICPLMNTLADLSDQAFQVIEGALKINIGYLRANSGVQTAWEIFRNFANAAFIIAFLVIIYSQVTGAGISSYGIKKMLPRLIIAAVLVNMSYLISQIMVDISQIIGASVKGLLDGIAPGGKMPEWKGLIGEALKGNVGGAALAGAALGGVAVIGLLAISGPVLAAATLAILITIIILIGRQAAIVILTAVAPIAFVAYLLPNTESLFRRWLKMFWGLLLVYPIISLLYGGGTLAGRIIASTASGEFWMSITALGVSVIPLIMTPKLLQGALNATGELGAKLSGAAGRATAGVSEKAKSSSRFAEVQRKFKLDAARRQANRRAGNSMLARFGRRVSASGDDKAGLSRLALKGAGNLMALPGNAFRKLDQSWAGRQLGFDAGASIAEAQLDKLFEEQVDMAQLTMRTMSTEDAVQIAKTGKQKDKNGKERTVSRAVRAAAIDKVGATGGFGDRRKALAGLSEGSDKILLQRMITIAYKKEDGEVYGVGFGDEMMSGQTVGEAGLARATVKNAAEGNVTPEQLVKSPSKTKYTFEAIDNDRGPHRATALENVRQSARKAVEGEETKVEVNGAIAATFRANGIHVD